LAITAKKFGIPPSYYLKDELGSYEQFCLDEMCAVVLTDVEEQARREALAEAENRSEGAKLRQQIKKGPLSLEDIGQIQDHWKKAGKYNI
jgi:hypothetical protein